MATTPAANRKASEPTTDTNPAEQNVETASAAHQADKARAKQDVRDNSTSNDPNLSGLTPDGSLAQSRADLPKGRPGYHCGYCGEPVGPEGQHWDEEGNAIQGKHAGTLVVADNWPELQDEQDKPKRDAEQAKRDGLTEK